MTERVGAILVAAGSSRRMGFDKLWARLGDRPVLDYALRTFADSPSVHRLAVVVAAERCEATRLLAEPLARDVIVCIGGARRRDSVTAGLDAVAGCTWVVVHDAARPFVSDEIIASGLAAARSSGAAIAVVSVKDTIKRVADGVVIETLRRDELWAVQTPQVFRTELLRRALSSSDEDVTDEAALVEQLGCDVRIFAGSEANWKITAPGDLELAEGWLAARRPIASRSGAA